LINTADEIKEEWFNGDEKVEYIGVSAGASTPDFLIEAVIKKLVDISGGTAEVVFSGKEQGNNKIFHSAF